MGYFVAIMTASTLAGLVIPLRGYRLAPKARCHHQPGATPQEFVPIFKNQALKARFHHQPGADAGGVMEISR